MHDNLTLDQLQLFLYVAEQGSFSAAGRRLDRAQSAVSYGIADLEQTLGVELFERGEGRPQLSRSGKALLGDVQRVFADINQIRARAAGMARSLEPELSLVVDAIVPTGLLVEICRVFRREFSDVSLRIHTEVLGSVAGLVLDGTCQVGISGPVGSDDKALQRRALGHVAIVPVAGRDHPLAKLSGMLPTSALRDHVQIVISERGHGGRDQGVFSDSIWRVAGTSTKLELIRAGLGWGHLPLDIVLNDFDKGKILPLLLEEWGPGHLEAPLFSISRADSPPGPAGQWLIKELAELCQPRSTSRSNDWSY